MVRTRLKSNDEETIVKPSIVSSYKKKVKPILNVVKPPVLPPSLLTKNKRTVRFKDFSGPGRKKMRRNATLNDLRRGKQVRYFDVISSSDIDIIL
jgi:hypothetical protein